jgi:hypothetical protein
MKISRKCPRKGLDIKIKIGHNLTTGQEGKILGILLMMMKIKREEELREEEEVAVEIEYISHSLVKIILTITTQGSSTVAEMISK